MATLLWKEFTEAWRSYRLLILAAVLLAAGMLGPLSAKYLPQLLARMADVPEALAELMPQPDKAMAVGEYVDNLVQFGAILAILMPMAAVVGEKAGGTAEFTLSKPVRRSSFLLAKFAAHATSFTVAVLAAALGGYYYTGLLFEWLPAANFLAANALVLLYLLVLVGLTLLSSTLARSQLAAAGVAFGALLAMRLLGAIPNLGRHLPAALIGWARALALSAPAEPAWSALALSLAVIGSALASAWLIFRCQEL
ncbi:MAG: ABC transporter permease subunit [Chloroflexota bacterium]